MEPSHGASFVFGFLAAWLVDAGSVEECPACSVSCGSLRCPPVNCSTDHIEFGPLAALILAGSSSFGIGGGRLSRDLQGRVL